MRPETSGVIQQEAQLRKVKPDTVFMPGWFKQHGFLAASTGKVFHKDDEQSWTASEAGKPTDPQEKAAMDSRSKRRKDGEAGAEWTKLDCDDAHTGDGVVARRAVDFIEQALSEKKRFFVAAGFRKPHLPWTAPKNYFAMYPAKEVTLDTEPEMKDVPDIARITDISGAPAPSSRAEAVAAYRACISFMDAQVGVLLADMDQKKLWDDTIVVFHSDHGYHLGDHGGLWAKLTDFEQCAGVPLVGAVPGGKKGGTCSRLVELIDLYPTLCELTGLTRPEGIEGRSLVPLLNDPKAEWNHPAFTVTVHEGVIGRSIRTNRWRFTEWNDGAKATELYDQQDDPLNYRNLAADPAKAEVIVGLRKELRSIPRYAGVIPDNVQNHPVKK